MPPSTSPKQSLGEPRKIISATPKFYIKDQGTDYDTGEEFNGIWSGGTFIDPTGYGSIGHWRLNEEAGAIGFNNRIRGQMNLRGRGINRGSDDIGSYITYNLKKDTPVDPLIGSADHYTMLGSPGTSIDEDAAFDTWLKTPGFDSLSYDNSEGLGDMRYFFDMWVYLYHPPAAGEKQTLLELWNDESTSYNRVLRFFIGNYSGNITVSMEYAKGNAATRSGVSVAHSYPAGAKLYPRGAGYDGGLHHIGFVLDRTRLSGGYIVFSEDDDNPEGIYVDGQKYTKTGNISTWYTGALEVNTNALIGCNILDPSSDLTAIRGGSGGQRFINHVQGKIYQIQMCHMTTLGEVSKERVRKVYSLKFDIPRGPRKVDFSDRFTQDGKHLLQTISQIKQAVELDEGTFFISVTDVRLINGQS